MSLAQMIQDAWNEQAKWLIVFRPLSWIYRGGFLLNKKLYKIIEKQIFGKLKDMRKRANVRGRDKVYSISIAIGKWLFDTIILVENSIQRYRKKI